MNEIRLYWPILFGIITFVVWLVRLEAKQLLLETRLNEHVENSRTNFKKLWTKLDELSTNVNDIKVSIGRIEENIKHD